MTVSENSPTMRFILPLLTSIVIGCSGQQTSKEQTNIDTAKLFNPTDEPDEMGAREVNIFKRNILLTQPYYYARLNDQMENLETLDEVKEFFKSNKNEIQKNKFYIITDSSTTFKKTVSIIDLLKENQITDYKVINIQQYFTPPEPVSVQTPTITNTKLTDSSVLFIEIPDKGINVKLLGQETRLKNTGDLDLFVTSHEPDIKMILVTITKGLPVDKFKAVLEVLRKHKIKYAIH